MPWLLILASKDFILALAFALAEISWLLDSSIRIGQGIDQTFKVFKGRPYG